MATDPFSGMKLSEHTPAPLDQRLFVTPRPTPTQTPDTQQPARPTVRGDTEQPPTRMPQDTTQFDLHLTPTELESMRLTEQEAEHLEDVWRDLRRLLGRKVAKNDIVRCALHHVIADYRQKRDGSLIVRLLQDKNG